MMLLLHRSCNIDGEGGSGFGGNGPHGGANQNLNLQQSSLGSYFSLFFFFWDMCHLLKAIPLEIPFY